MEVFGATLRPPYRASAKPLGSQAVMTEHPTTEPPPQASAVDSDELILEGDEHLIAARVTLPSAASKELPVDTPRVMPLRGNDV
jgi:hypothetical protein